MKCVVGHGPPSQLSKNLGVPCHRPVERLEHEYRGTFAKVQPLAILIEGPARIWVQRLQGAKPAQSERTKRVTAPRQHHGRHSVEQHVCGKRDRHRARSARRGDRTARSANSQILTHGISNARWRIGRGPRETTVPIPGRRILSNSRINLAQSSDRAGHHDAALAEGNALAIEILSPRLEPPPSPVDHSENIGSCCPSSGIGSAQTGAVLPTKPGYRSFVGARQHLPDNMPSCRQSSPMP